MSGELGGSSRLAYIEGIIPALPTGAEPRILVSVSAPAGSAVVESWHKFSEEGIFTDRENNLFCAKCSDFEVNNVVLAERVRVERWTSTIHHEDRFDSAYKRISSTPHSIIKKASTARL